MRRDSQSSAILLETILRYDVQVVVALSWLYFGKTRGAQLKKTLQIVPRVMAGFGLM